MLYLLFLVKSITEMPGESRTRAYAYAYYLWAENKRQIYRYEFVVCVLIESTDRRDDVAARVLNAPLGSADCRHLSVAREQTKSVLKRREK